MKQVSVIIHLDLADSWEGHDRELERYVLDAVRPALADAEAVDAEVVPEPLPAPRPAEVHYPREDVPQAFLTARERSRRDGWTI